MALQGLSLNPVGSGLGRAAVRLVPGVLLMSALPLATPLEAQMLQARNPDCNSYARAYADAHVSSDPTDLDIVDKAMEGAVAGDAWRGPRGARRGAAAGGALAVLDRLGNDPAGWRGLYDLAFRLCREQQSSVTHRPTTLGDPSYRPVPAPSRKPEPPVPPFPLAPSKPER